MAMTRADLLAYLVNQYGPLATLTGQTSLDEDAGYGPALDDTALSLSVDYADIADYEVTAGYEISARALARYHTLRHFEQKLAAKVDFDVSGASASVTKKQSAQLAQVRAMLAEARAEVSAYGYAIGVYGIQSVQYNPPVPLRELELLA